MLFFVTINQGLVGTIGVLQVLLLLLLLMSCVSRKKNHSLSKVTTLSRHNVRNNVEEVVLIASPVSGHDQRH